MFNLENMETKHFNFIEISPHFFSAKALRQFLLCPVPHAVRCNYILVGCGEIRNGIEL